MMDIRPTSDSEAIWNNLSMATIQWYELKLNWFLNGVIHAKGHRSSNTRDFSSNYFVLRLNRFHCDLGQT